MFLACSYCSDLMHSFCVFRKQIHFYQSEVTIDFVLWDLVFIFGLVDKECHHALLLFL